MSLFLKHTLFSESVLAKSFLLIPQSERKKLYFVSTIQIFSGLLDLLGVILAGMLGALAFSGGNERGPGDRLSAALRLLHLESTPLKYQLLLIGTVATLIFIVKTAFSISFMKKSLNFLSRISGSISGQLFSNMISSPYQDIKTVDSQEITFAIRWGVRATIVGVAGAALSLASDLFLTAALIIAIMMIDLSVALITLVFFGLVGLVLYKQMNNKARYLGQQEAILSVEIDREIGETLGALKELIVRKRLAHYNKLVGNALGRVARIQAEQAFMPFISKYVIEASIVIATFTIVLIQFTTQESSRAAATITIFFAASSRIAPAVLRMQQNLLAIKGNIGVAETTLHVINKFVNVERRDLGRGEFRDSHPNFNGEIVISNLTYRYDMVSVPAVRDISFNVGAGEFVGIVGASGAGKSTLANLMLGILEPTSGSVLLSGKSPRDAISQHPGAVAYVPQDVFVANLDIRSNIALGFNSDEIPESRIMETAETSDLKEFLSKKKDGLNFQVGENGNKLSGGEKQRLGIARALITRPKILVMDEATSSLDGKTENEITRAVENLAGTTSIIVIAHRLSTVKNADRIIFIENGLKVDEGTFSQLRERSSKFRILCEYMGL
jgi:ABC-type multidrug transport system fused ATPase/permease subunit